MTIATVMAQKLGPRELNPEEEAANAVRFSAIIQKAADLLSMENSMAIRCKMRLENVFAQTWGGSKAIFRCEYDQKLCEEDRAFQKATPNGMAEFQIDNPKAAEQLVIGAYYYVDFTPL